MKSLRIAVPSGVGDVYWCLTKLKSYRLKQDIDHVTLCVQKTRLARALEWGQMVDFVDDACYLNFDADTDALTKGSSGGRTPYADVCWWPNTIVDRGQHLSNWMPNYDLDLNFPIKVVEPKPERERLGLVYASSDSIHAAWFPTVTPRFWDELLATFSKHLHTAIIGAWWDAGFRSAMRPSSEILDLVSQTSLMEVAGLIKNARVIVGVISGMTILANHFGTPCIAFCPDKFPAPFPHTWVRPETPYIVLRPQEIHSAAQIADLALSIARPANGQ